MWRRCKAILIECHRTIFGHPTNDSSNCYVVPPPSDFWANWAKRKIELVRYLFTRVYAQTLCSTCVVPNLIDVGAAAAAGENEGGWVFVLYFRFVCKLCAHVITNQGSEFALKSTRTNRTSIIRAFNGFSAGGELFYGRSLRCERHALDSICDHSLTPQCGPKTHAR